jgi:hypothetical protein
MGANIVVHYHRIDGRTSMAWIKIGAPGTKWGPCANPKCPHLDCKSLRDLADKVCTECEVRIGYETPMVTAQEEKGQGQYDHLDCALVVAEGQR